MTRAQETAKIIEAIIKNVAVNNDSILIEGAPIPPEPPIGHWKSEVHVGILYKISIFYSENLKNLIFYLHKVILFNINIF